MYTALKVCLIFLFIHIGSSLHLGKIENKVLIIFSLKNEIVTEISFFKKREKNSSGLMISRKRLIWLSYRDRIPVILYKICWL